MIVGIVKLGFLEREEVSVISHLNAGLDKVSRIINTIFPYILRTMSDIRLYLGGAGHPESRLLEQRAHPAGPRASQGGRQVRTVV